MDLDLKHWAKLHVTDAVALRDRWQTNPEGRVDDPLLENGRFHEPTGVWTVANELELVRLIGAIQWRNPTMSLWFRGEGRYYEEALPKRLRPSSDQTLTPKGIEWLNEHAGRDRVLRDRGPLARAAILEHYGCPTSLLDLTSSYDVACAFAFECPPGKAHLRVYALPRHRDAISFFDEADVVLVDLRAELPSYCLRPHVQQAAFLGRRRAVYRDVVGEQAVPTAEAVVDALCIAHIRLNFDGSSRFYEPRKNADMLYPKPSATCRVCTGRADMSGDYLYHLLQCFKIKGSKPCPWQFPS